MNEALSKTELKSHFEGEVGFDLTFTGEPVPTLPTVPTVRLKFSFSDTKREYFGGV